MTGFELRTSGIGSNCSTNWATQPLPNFLLTDEKNKIKKKRQGMAHLSNYSSKQW